MVIFLYDDWPPCPLRKAHSSRLARGGYAAEVAVAVRLAVDCGKAMRDPRSRWVLGIPGKSKNVNGGYYR